MNNVLIIRFLRLRVLFEKLYAFIGRHKFLLLSGFIGALGGLSSIFFRKAINLFTLVITGDTGAIEHIFSGLSLWHRMLIPPAGGAAAGLIFFFGSKFISRRSGTTDYMEAIVLGEGTISFRQSLTKILSSLFSISTGASIGREGPMVQLSSLIASLPGKKRGWTISQRRLMLACGASAGIASAYNAPIAGALFVAEILFGTISIKTLGPLLLSSVLAAQTLRLYTGGSPIYLIPQFALNSPFDMAAYLALGLLIGLAAPLFLRSLQASEKIFQMTRLPVYLKTAAGGLIVGLIAINYPLVCGNGYEVINGILQERYLWQNLAVLLLFKLLATSASFGSGAVGGVFTPTLFMGAGISYLFGSLCGATGITMPSPGAFALAGMGMFLSAATHAPLMAIIMIFEMTLSYQLILPLMLGCVVAHFVSHSIEPRSIYSTSMERKGALQFSQMLADLQISDIMKRDPVHVVDTSTFNEIAKQFIVNTFRYLYVIDKRGSYIGAICLDDIKEYLSNASLSNLIIARDIISPGPPSVRVSSSLEDALKKFMQFGQNSERIPVVSDEKTELLIGSIAKTDILLAISERRA
ncbi:MAG: ClcB-like voltage-gated chloride channel protein [Spirochaetes bacterium]|nr:ClcB-like voltage-gated chloride channel protein [Spirochaetota bacterium]